MKGFGGTGGLEGVGRCGRSAGWEMVGERDGAAAGVRAGARAERGAGGGAKGIGSPGRGGKGWDEMGRPCAGGCRRASASLDTPGLLSLGI